MIWSGWVRNQCRALMKTEISRRKPVTESYCDLAEQRSRLAHQISLKSDIIFFPHLRLGLTRVLFLWYFPTKILCIRHVPLILSIVCNLMTLNFQSLLSNLTVCMYTKVSIQSLIHKNCKTPWMRVRHMQHIQS